MQVTRQITNDITYVGVSDRRLSLFENIFPIPRGVSYNSYIINDEKTALIDAVDYDSSRVFVENVKAALNGKTLDYIFLNNIKSPAGTMPGGLLPFPPARRDIFYFNCQP